MAALIELKVVKEGIYGTIDGKDTKLPIGHQFLATKNVFPRYCEVVDKDAEKKLTVNPKKSTKAN